MRIPTSLATVAALAAAVFTQLPTPTPAPSAGPAAAIAAVERFLAAQDKGDIDDLIACFDGKSKPMVGFDLADGKRVDWNGPSQMMWSDVDRQGEPMHAAKPDYLVKMLSGHTGKRTITKIRADCDSPACSVAVLDFTWTRREGDKEVATPLRATALLRYDDKEQRFRVYHWHASRSVAAGK